ncbi:hypothetical protein AMTR_s01935p00009340 [Amborella trichopoda]|uniref:Uncharacterized protein n=1 Tax=Amborella trichopoda TaxID=13333 RepID=W1P4S9_AMBTC|nr:hypothetical protein AMTR_s01935p00009340 [Amborella trichopoda]
MAKVEFGGGHIPMILALRRLLSAEILCYNMKGHEVLASNNDISCFELSSKLPRFAIGNPLTKREFFYIPSPELKCDWLDIRFHFDPMILHFKIMVTDSVKKKQGWIFDSSL